MRGDHPPVRSLLEVMTRPAVSFDLRVGQRRETLGDSPRKLARQEAKVDLDSLLVLAN